MEHGSVFIMDNDASFVNRLSSELKLLNPELNISIATDKDQAERLMERRPTLVVCGEALKPKRVLAHCKLVTIAEQSTQAGAGVTITRDLGGAGHSARQVMQALAHRCAIVGVTSPCGGSGKTTYAWGLACAAARAGKTPFFLSLEGTMGANPFAKSTSIGFDQVLAMLEYEEALIDRLQQAACIHEETRVHTFVPGERLIDREELTGTQVALLLGTLKSLCKWDVIIVDMESRMDERMLMIWDMADDMVLVLPVTGQAEAKKQTMQKELDLWRARGKNYWDKIVPVLNRIVPNYELAGRDKRFGALDAVSAQRFIPEGETMDAGRWFHYIVNHMSAVFDKLFEGLKV